MYVVYAPMKKFRMDAPVGWFEEEERANDFAAHLRHNGEKSYVQYEYNIVTIDTEHVDHTFEP